MTVKNKGKYSLSTGAITLKVDMKEAPDKFIMLLIDETIRLYMTLNPLSSEINYI